LREVWQDAAVFVPPGDPHRLEAALQALIENPPHRARMARRAAARAREFTPDRMVRAYIDAYRVAAESRSAACVS
jgi:glycosyltransferase involved in cell wall biosynthesis